MYPQAGTLRYLAPEALEGALDLSGARAALCAVDVFALGLVLWEMVWRTDGAHVGRTPPYAQPYSHHGLPQKPSLAEMQVGYLIGELLTKTSAPTLCYLIRGLLTKTC